MIVNPGTCIARPSLFVPTVASPLCVLLYTGDTLECIQAKLTQKLSEAKQAACAMDVFHETVAKAEAAKLSKAKATVGKAGP